MNLFKGYCVGKERTYPVVELNSENAVCDYIKRYKDKLSEVVITDKYGKEIAKSKNGKMVKIPYEWGVFMALSK